MLVDNDPPLFSISRPSIITISAGTNFTYTNSIVLCWAPLAFIPNPGNVLLQDPYTWVGKITTSISDTSGYTTSKGGMTASGMTIVSTTLGAFTQTIAGTVGAGMWEQGRFEWISDIAGDFVRSVGGTLPVLTMLTDVYINDVTNGTVKYLKGSAYTASFGTWIIFKAL